MDEYKPSFLERARSFVYLVQQVASAACYSAGAYALYEAARALGGAL